MSVCFLRPAEFGSALGSAGDFKTARGDLGRVPSVDKGRRAGNGIAVDLMRVHLSRPFIHGGAEALLGVGGPIEIILRIVHLDIRREQLGVIRWGELGFEALHVGGSGRDGDETPEEVGFAPLDGVRLPLELVGVRSPTVITAVFIPEPEGSSDVAASAVVPGLSDLEVVAGASGCVVAAGSETVVAVPSLSVDPPHAARKRVNNATRSVICTSLLLLMSRLSISLR